MPGLSHLSVSKNETLAERRDKTDKLWSTFLSSLIIQAPGVRTTDTLRFMRAARTRTVLRSRLSQREEAPVSDELISLLASIVATARAESEAVGSAFTFVYLPPPLGFSAVDNGVLRKDWKF